MSKMIFGDFEKLYVSSSVNSTLGIKDILLCHEKKEVCGDQERGFNEVGGFHDDTHTWVHRLQTLSLQASWAVRDMQHTSSYRVLEQPEDCSLTNKPGLYLQQQTN